MDRGSSSVTAGPQSGPLCLHSMSSKFNWISTPFNHHQLHVCNVNHVVGRTQPTYFKASWFPARLFEVRCSDSLLLCSGARPHVSEKPLGFPARSFEVGCSTFFRWCSDRVGARVLEEELIFLTRCYYAAEPDHLCLVWRFGFGGGSFQTPKIAPESPGIELQIFGPKFDTATITLYQLDFVLLIPEGA